MSEKELTRQQLKPVAEALANQNIMRNGSPPFTNPLDLLESTGNTKLLDQVYGDAEAAVEAWLKAVAETEKVTACEVTRHLADLQAYIENPQRYADYHSTTAAGMSLLIERIVVGLDALVAETTRQVRAEEEGKYEEIACLRCGGTTFDPDGLTPLSKCRGCGGTGKLFRLRGE